MARGVGGHASCHGVHQADQEASSGGTIARGGRARGVPAWGQCGVQLWGHFGRAIGGRVWQAPRDSRGAAGIVQGAHG